MSVLRSKSSRLGAIAIVLAAAVHAVALPGASARAADNDITLATAAKRAGTFNQFLLAAKQSGLDTELAGKGPWTVFAPTDEAIGKLPDGLWFKLLQPENRDLLKTIVRFHMVPGEYPPQRLMAASANLYTIPGAGGPVLIDISNGKIEVNRATVTSETFLAASNGLMHQIDTVLIPKEVKAAVDKL